MATLAADIDIAIELAHGALAEIAAEELPLFDVTNRASRAKPARLAAASARNKMLRSATAKTISTPTLITRSRRLDMLPTVAVFGASV